VRRAAAALTLLVFQALAGYAGAEVVRIDIARRDDFGTHERLIGRVYFTADPRLPANQSIVDVERAPRNADGRVEYSSDLLFFQPKDPARARGTVFLEVVNRGRDQFLGLLSGAVQRDLSPASWNLGDRFLLERGFAVAFLGWQFDVPPGQGLGLDAPVAPVDGDVRSTAISIDAGPRGLAFALPYCATPTGRDSASLTFREQLDQPSTVVPRERWRFERNGCVVSMSGPTRVGIYEAIYPAHGSPVAGLGLAAVRDFASYLKYGGRVSTLRERPATVARVVAAGYSQSGRFLREVVRDGFTSDERGRPAFDGLLIASAGAGGGSFNHRFAMPGQAGNSVLSILRPVDTPPFLDEGLLARARAASSLPRIVYTFSSTEYWARAGSLTHTSEDGLRDVPLADSSRLYFLSGTPHAAGPATPIRETASGSFAQLLNFAAQRWLLRAITMALDGWVSTGTAPPASRYPTIAAGQLVPRSSVRFPKTTRIPFPDYMPHVWRLDFGPAFARAGVVREPPVVGQPYPVLVPQVDADGNDVGGVRALEVAVPLGTFTGWNVAQPPLATLGYLSGLTGSFEPFRRRRDERGAESDPRPSIEERYRDEAGYVARLRDAARDLASTGFLLTEDVEAAVESARGLWSRIVESPP
jgi:hypothetical protein